MAAFVARRAALSGVALISAGTKEVKGCSIRRRWYRAAPAEVFSQPTDSDLKREALLNADPLRLGYESCR